MLLQLLRYVVASGELYRDQDPEARRLEFLRPFKTPEAKPQRPNACVASNVQCARINAVSENKSVPFFLLSSG